MSQIGENIILALRNAYKMLFDKGVGKLREAEVEL